MNQQRNQGTAREAQQATGEQQTDEREDVELRQRFARQMANELRCAPEPRGLARLDAAGVAAICEILADVIDEREYALWEGDLRREWGELRAEEIVNAARLDFIAEVRRRIYDRATPATTPAVRGGVK